MPPATRAISSWSSGRHLLDGQANFQTFRSSSVVAPFPAVTRRYFSDQESYEKEVCESRE